ncbi:FAD-binding oxidoreductase [Pseudomonas sp. P8_241]|uniref:FAD-binding oxidoreductase n=1 Tax=Pseudomonas sp. P8_241 TaxID=3043445 RepID=UPI002A3602A6|nr:FAD-binding oxidoreductase [Pseudomonas sp. P8_241]WPN49687.1 FAD-binding oxidoreductase [Pseudomonas sp. P8_241]
MTSYSVLPAGVTQEHFALAINAFRHLLGDAQVISEPQRLAPYRKIMLPHDENDYAASAALLPDSVEQVQGILKICNRFKVPLWPISTGRNFGYGSAAPGERGQVVLDLKRMNRILEVDAQLCTALVEPGVTYKQLQDYLKERNIPLWLSFPAPGPIAGPVGNTLERGEGNTPYGDHFNNACGMEVVLANGEVLRTGTGGLPNSNSWQIFKYGFGPYLDGLFTQSNFGVVTKLGLWLMPAPAGHRTVLVQYDEAQLETAIDTLAPLRIAGLIPNVGVMANAAIALTSAKTRHDIYQGTGPVPQDIIRSEAKKIGLADWNIIFTLYGSEERIAADYKLVSQAFERSGARVIPDIHDPMQVNELSLDAFRLYNWRGGGGSMWFSPICPARGRDFVEQTRLARSIYEEFGFDYMSAPALSGRALHHVMPLEYDRTDAEETQRAHRCFEKLMDEFAKRGHAVYRTGIGYMDKLADSYGPVKKEVNRAIKRALDPNGILAPGKSGIRL